MLLVDDKGLRASTTGMKPRTVAMTRARRWTLERDPNVIMMLLLDGLVYTLVRSVCDKKTKRSVSGRYVHSLGVETERACATLCEGQRKSRYLSKKECTLSKSRNCSGTWKEPPDCWSMLSSCTGSYKADIVSSRSPDGRDPGAGRKVTLSAPSASY